MMDYISLKLSAVEGNLLTTSYTPRSTEHTSMTTGYNAKREGKTLIRWVHIKGRTRMHLKGEADRMGT